MGGRSALRRLFEPIKIGEMTVKNRIAMSPMGMGFATREGLITERTKVYYATRAEGGVGLIIVECSCVDFPRGIHAFHRLVIDHDRTLPGLTELAQAIKKCGARASIQLNHGGRMVNSKITGLQPVAPSSIPYLSAAFRQGEVPKELTVEEISEIVDLFARAALRAKRAGFDGVEVNAGHGYLLAQFLSPFSNQRRDSYGGPIENRARILIEVLQAVRKNVGDDYPLWCRINGQEYGVEDGFTLDDSKAVAKMVEGIVNAIHVTAWGYGKDCLANYPETSGGLLPLAEAIKSVFAKPVIAVGRLTPELGEQAIEEGKADIIALGRELIADPEIPLKALSGRCDDIRPCIACFHCHDSGVMRDSSVECAVNVIAGREKDPAYEIKPAAVVKKIGIIGGGPAAMEAARVLSIRGHKVVLFEKEAQLGGQLTLAAIPPHKERIRPLTTYLMTQIEKLGVEIRLRTEASVEEIRSLNPDAVVLAAGGVPLVPQLPGVNLDHVVNAIDVLADRAEVGQKVVVIGAGSTGCEIAEFLFEKGKEVTVVEMRTELAADMGFRERVRLMLRITNRAINFLTSVKCSEIKKGGVWVMKKQEEEQFIPADTVVLSVGTRPNNSLLPLLEEEGFQTYPIGDCGKGARIVDAMGDAFRLGCIL
jgi:2,4-dienoyl-CoA reductase-like NADH-dependent reductase (Old Yellow Enzyme family)/thioredoxin reductase